mgnify:CR=1 FL=1
MTGTVNYDYNSLPHWPNCPVPDCQFKINLWAGEGLCSPHTKTKIGPLEFQRRWEDTRDDQGFWNGQVASR